MIGLVSGGNRDWDAGNLSIWELWLIRIALTISLTIRQNHDPSGQSRNRAVKLLDFAEANGWYQFRFEGGDPKSFKLALAFVKSIPLEERAYWPDKDHLWEVRAGPENEEILAWAFSNGKLCIETLKASVKLPGF